MTGSRGTVLYSPALLALAVDLANYPLNHTATVHGHARSRTCGSTVELSSGNPERLAELGVKVVACAVGQAAAAIFARSAEGLGRDACDQALAEIRQWLRGEDELPSWPGFEALVSAREFPGRHEAIQLPWRAALDALCKPAVDR